MGLAQQFGLLQIISLSLFFWFSEMHNILIRYSLGRSLFRAQMLFCQIEHLGYFIHRFKFTHLNNKKSINIAFNWLNSEIIQPNTHKRTYTSTRPTNAHTIKNRDTQALLMLFIFKQLIQVHIQLNKYISRDTSTKTVAHISKLLHLLSQQQQPRHSSSSPDDIRS